MEPFVFKKFTIWQKHAAMRVNTDGVLLSAWCNYNYFKDYSSISLLDIGTGTGLIALIATQFLVTQGNRNIDILAIDIDEKAILDAEYNFDNSIWNTIEDVNLRLEKRYLQELSGEKFNLIISNPPYFIDSLKAQTQSKNNARHTDSLSQEDLISGVLRNIKLKGMFCLILPVEEGEIFIEKTKNSIINGNKLHLARICYVRTIQKKAPKRMLMEFCADYYNEIYTAQENILTIMDKCDFTNEYKKLTKDLYLKF